MNYTENLTYLAQYAGDADLATDPDFLAQLPIFLQSAELRILRDLDLLSARVEDTSGVLTANQREFILPTEDGVFNVVETVSLVIDNIRQRPLVWLSKEAMDWSYPDRHAVGNPSVPVYCAPFTDEVILIGPPPGEAYPVVVYGQVTPRGLSEETDETFISVNLPDLLLAAEMIDVSAWQRKFGAMSSDPQQALDWSQEYQRLLKQADVQESRRQIESVGWSTKQPNTTATPPQT